MHNEEFEMIAKTFMGLENILAEELTQMGANNIEIGRRMVSFTGNKELLYRANFQLHTAIRVLKPIAHFKANSAEDMYEAVKKIDWSQYIDPGKTFSVDSVVYSEEFRNSRFVTYKVKDAIVDQFRELTGNRPNISVSNPDIRLNIHIAEDKATLSLDSSGESLHRRGYRQEGIEAPINEVLAAGLILMTGWHGETDFIDPMCGSGTLLIEAALIARNISPGVFRKEYAFEKWNDFDSELFDEIYNDDSKEREFTNHIYGYDVDMKAVNTALMNVRAAGLTKDISVKQQDFKDFTKPANKSIIITNPPYGERISTPNLLGTYKMIGERLKHEFGGNDAWILSYREECFEQIGLKPSIKIPVFNGSLECEFRKYAMFDGRMKDFRAEGGIVKTEEEKNEMAQKHRFKKNRDFKQRITDEEANEQADIRSFKFRSFEVNHLGEPIKKRNRPFDDDSRERNRDNNRFSGKRFKNDERDGNRRDRGNKREDRRFGKNDRRFGKDDRRFGKDDKRFEKDDRRFKKGGKQFDKKNRRNSNNLEKRRRMFGDED